MNKFFGFLKEKIIQAKQENKKELQKTLAVINDQQYSSDKMTQLIQKMKQNYFLWCIIITNEASNGLYYSQLHNRSVALGRVVLNKQIRHSTQKTRIVANQMKKTHLQLNAINRLADKWVLEMSADIEEINANIDWEHFSMNKSQLNIIPKSNENLESETSIAQAAATKQDKTFVSNQNQVAKDEFQKKVNQFSVQQRQYKCQIIKEINEKQNEGIKNNSQIKVIDNQVSFQQKQFQISFTNVDSKEEEFHSGFRQNMNGTKQCDNQNVLKQEILIHNTDSKANEAVQPNETISNQNKQKQTEIEQIEKQIE